MDSYIVLQRLHMSLEDMKQVIADIRYWYHVRGYKFLAARAKVVRELDLAKPEKTLINSYLGSVFGSHKKKVKTVTLPEPIKQDENCFLYKEGNCDCKTAYAEHGGCVFGQE